jgi:hypothetical protein
MNRLMFTMILLVSAVFSGCELAEGIFKAGFWSGIFIVALVVGLIIYFLTRKK